MLKLNLGCGPVQPPGWTNVDGSHRAWLAARLPRVDRLLVRCKLLPETEFNRATVFANLTKPLPWGDGVASVAYLGELLEHLTRDNAVRLLAECFRVLGPGGIIRVRVPDNARFWQNYLGEYESIRAQPRAEWTDTHTRWVEMFFREICVRPRLLSSSAHYHSGCGTRCRSPSRSKGSVSPASVGALCSTVRLRMSPPSRRART